MKIKFLGMPFASKVLAFAAPSQAGIYDSVISDYLTRTADAAVRSRVQGVGVTRVGQKQLDAYQKWCEFCQSEAKILNEHGLTWIDWNGQSCNWRAVDVERAHFVIASVRSVDLPDG